VGDGVLCDGKLIKTSVTDMTSSSLEHRTGTHISLHPSGEAHVKSGSRAVIVAANIGQWLPVRRAFVFAHWFTAAIRTLPLAQGGGPAFGVADASKSLRLDIVICPLQRTGDKEYVPYNENTLFLGWSPHYAVLLNAEAIPACDPCVFFLACPLAE